MANEKEICPCGCKRKLSRATINRHLGGKGPGTLALHVLANTRTLQCRGKKSKASYSMKQVLLGKSSQRRKRPVKQKESAEETTPDSCEDLLEGEVLVQPDDAHILMNEPMPTVEPTDTLPDQGHVLSTARRSNRVAAKLVQVQQFRWGTGHAEFTQEEDEEEVGGVDMNGGDLPDREDDEEEEEDWDEDDWQNVMSAAPGQEGISTWDLLGEGFLKEASELGV
ncbi:hypothetical protein M378DRAFT_181112 [Amanita muscaria Koide BX008]|uniref:Uncharacterized protein n=1 Tax=Amanita muscaria (strain Koide BX008) TaxID=946122 RepID=A0A0C2WRA1_AMAMK|nr:hypothetical protein M378DRAFT_181112 [Amanita muscaria Koide BX008]